MSPDTPPIRLVLIDDQALVRTGIGMILDAEDDIEVVGEAGDGRAGLALVREKQPDVVLMDVRMPVMDGIEATSRITSDPALSARVLMLTTFDTDDGVVGAMRAGASGFLLKDSTPEDIVRAVRAVAVGDAVVSPSAMRKLLAAMGPSLGGTGLAETPSAPASPATAPSTPLSTARRIHPSISALTEREAEVLGLIGEGLNNAEIAERLFLSEATVKTHVSRVLGKLAARDRIQAVLIARDAGLSGTPGE